MERKGVKGFVLVVHEKVPHGFALSSGDGSGSGTADVAVDCGRPAQLTMDYWEELGVHLS